MDWIRVIVFDILVLYHVGMFFVPWTWVVKNNVLSELFIYPMTFLSQWRLPILFVVSWMGARFALSSRSSKQFINERINRLIIPLIFSILIIVPPQVYLERLSQGINYSSFLDFYPDFFKGVYPKGNLSWHHLWFLPYLLFYSIFFTPLFIYLRRINNSGFFQILKSNLNKYPISIFLVTIPLIIIKILLQPIFPVTMAFIGDWYALLFYSVFFITGFILISIYDVWWNIVARLKLLTFILGIILTFVQIYGFNNNISHEVFQF